MVTHYNLINLYLLASYFYLQVDLMKETVERSYEVEEKKGGLVIKKALYGKLGSGEDLL